MVRMINALTGTDMWVAENRVDEYKAAGHKLAAEPEIHTEAPKVEVKKKATTTKKTTKAKK